jgi:hypothetical protein
MPKKTQRGRTIDWFNTKIDNFKRTRSVFIRRREDDIADNAWNVPTGFRYPSNIPGNAGA